MSVVALFIPPIALPGLGMSAVSLLFVLCSDSTLYFPSILQHAKNMVPHSRRFLLMLCRGTSIMKMTRISLVVSYPWYLLLYPCVSLSQLLSGLYRSSSPVRLVTSVICLKSAPAEALVGWSWTDYIPHFSWSDPDVYHLDGHSVVIFSSFVVSSSTNLNLTSAAHGSHCKVFAWRRPGNSQKMKDTSNSSLDPLPFPYAHPGNLMIWITLVSTPSPAFKLGEFLEAQIQITTIAPIHLEHDGMAHWRSIYKSWTTYFYRIHLIDLVKFLFETWKARSFRRLAGVPRVNFYRSKFPCIRTFPGEPPVDRLFQRPHRTRMIQTPKESTWNLFHSFNIGALSRLCHVRTDWLRRDIAFFNCDTILVSLFATLKILSCSLQSLLCLCICILVPPYYCVHRSAVQCNESQVILSSWYSPEQFRCRRGMAWRP